MFIRRDRTDEEIAAEIRSLVGQFGLHSGLIFDGRRCCTQGELDAAIAHEIKERRERNSTSMIVTTGRGDSAPGVWLPPAPKH